MKNVSYFLSLFIIFTVSIVFLSTSYSKESGTLLNNSITKEEVDNIVITYSNTNLITSNSDNYISIVNKNNHPVSYQIELIKMDDSTEEIYYQLDNKDIKMLGKNNVILEEDLDSYGSDKDQVTHIINLSGSKSNKYIITLKESTIIKNVVSKDNNTYMKDGNIYYYGEDPNNYVLYNNELYRILGLENNVVKIISLNGELNTYQEDKSYPTLSDIYNTYKDEVNIDNISDNESFINSESFWLKDSYDDNSNYYYRKDNTIQVSNKDILHFNRETKYIKGYLKIEKGLGTIDEPYEVKDESR